MNRRHFIFSLGLGSAALAVAAQAQSAGPRISVIKSKTCGCCGMWLEHLKQNGFTVTSEDVEDLYERKDKMKIPAELQSCHTGVVEGYLIEGHVPAADILRLLKEKPKALGIAVPGMPTGSPGMEMGSKKDAFKVILFTEDGKQTVWNEYKGN
jgi:hypothetical protein